MSDKQTVEQTSKQKLPALSVAEALAILDAEPVEPVVEDGARVGVGRRLAGPLRTDRPYPPFDKAMMDGFAIRAADIHRREFDIVGDASAGKLVGGAQAGQAVRIATGAPVPAGTDTVVPIELCTVDDVAERVTIDGDVRLGDHIATISSDRAAGDVIIPAGSRLDVGMMAAACSVDHEGDVFRKPSVLVLCTGNEVVPDGQTPGLYQTRNAIGEPIRALLERIGCAAVHQPDPLPDNRAVIRRATEDALAGPSDALVFSGGMSMSNHDHVPHVLRALGFEFRIDKLRIRPGKPFVCAVLPPSRSQTGRTRYVFGLPGNPVSAFVCTLRLASRLLIRLGGGDPNREMPVLPMPLAEGLDKANGPREFYQPCRVDEVGVHPLAWRGSADVFTLAQADALLIRPENDPPHAPAELVKILPIPR